MKIGYGTYAMQTENIFHALPRLCDIGYEALEINTGDDWPTAPHKLDTATRKTLAKTIQDLGFESPVTMALMPICTQAMNAPPSSKNLTTPVSSPVTSPSAIIPASSSAHSADCTAPGTKSNTSTAINSSNWATALQNTMSSSQPNPMAGHPLDTPQKVDWLMRQTNHDNVKVNFDMSHFHVDGIDLQPSVDLCAPYTVSTHIKDGHRVNGQVRYLLPGEGDFDLVAFFKAVAAAGITVPITRGLSKSPRKSGDSPTTTPGPSPNNVSEHSTTHAQNQVLHRQIRINHALQHPPHPDRSTALGLTRLLRCKRRTHPQPRPPRQ